jgi:hypothetical protein
MHQDLVKHWPEYLMEAAELGIFMVSATLFTILLYHPASPAVRAIPPEFIRRVLMGLAMGLTLVGIVFSPWGKQSGAHMNPAFTLTFYRLERKPMSRFLFSLLFIGVVSANAQPAPIVFQSATEQTALLELYTSEGCSSCPPAETWLSRLKESPGLWKNFVPVAFHVDYWDYLGWRDPWAAREFSDRQRSYAEHWHSATVYTPGFVLNGKEWRDWAERREGPKPSGGKAGVLTVSSSDTNRWTVSFAPANPGRINYEVHGALLAGDVRSEVKAGENRGRRLNHDFAVLTLVHGPLIHSSNVAQGEFVISGRRSSDGGSLALAVWINEAEHPEPLQATGGWIAHPISNR